MKVLFVTTSLGTGGAEMQLAHLVAGLNGAMQIKVFALRGGAVAEKIRACGVPLTVCEIRGLASLVTCLRRLIEDTRAFRPDVIQGWMYHGNLAATLAWRMAAPRAKLFWGIRQSLYELAREKMPTRWVIRLSAWISRWPTAIAYNSHTARSQHEGFGFSATRACVIDNGFDTERFRPDPQARLAVRQMLGVAPETPLIGLIARYHPMKGHVIFLDAAARLAQQKPDVHFLLIGREVFPENPALAQVFHHPALSGRVHCLGERDDIPRLTAALDIASSSSRGEAFPNAVGEAMACGVAVVATDVGDVRRIVGDAGVVVQAGDAIGMTEAWQRLLDEPALRRCMAEAGRRRVVAQFSLYGLHEHYERLFTGHG